MKTELLNFLHAQTSALKKQGLYKSELTLTGPQEAVIQIQGNHCINLCSNNYLGLDNHPEVIQAAEQALRTYGYGLSSVRFICGTQTLHKELEQKISQHLKAEDTLLYSSCFDANTGLFETLFDENDAILSDALNHASIIDGIRLCKAQRFRYENNNMEDLERKLKAASRARFKLIATDGVFSMEGTFANLPHICDLAEHYNAMVMVDDSHAVGFIGETGGGTPEYWKVTERVDLLTGTLGKALGGASGGYTSGPKIIIDWLRQRSRPYLFSNSLAPMIVGASLKVFDLIKQHQALRVTLENNTHYFRRELTALGFNVIPGNHPIIPILLFDAQRAADMAKALFKEGVYVVSFSYPVVPENQARIRVQLSARHRQEDLNKALHAFERVGKKLKVIS